ncbi:hypothetical protein K466DRAFT_115289 [Polyporus arcularius HHB13444]|uniref:Uncharacterized protein n=1 Tax=Polyporus arcularius HHB13444 TaxID=1314778 RepID=A0A5C3PFD9_9APHY|nr:hypothetical protein K466DRAFT_115289 [Polyporus arcularius HHB13444]
MIRRILDSRSLREGGEAGEREREQEGSGGERRRASGEAPRRESCPKGSRWQMVALGGARGRGSRSPARCFLSCAEWKFSAGRWGEKERESMAACGVRALPETTEGRYVSPSAATVHCLFGTQRLYARRPRRVSAFLPASSGLPPPAVLLPTLHGSFLIHDAARPSAPSDARHPTPTRLQRRLMHLIGRHRLVGGNTHLRWT